MVLTFRFIGTSLVGSLTVSLVCAFAPLPAQIGVLGSCVSMLCGLFVSYVEQEEKRENRRMEVLRRLRTCPKTDLATSWEGWIIQCS